jgi:xanthine dehydrogenase YagR molybdenum-binding subunit
MTVLNTLGAPISRVEGPLKVTGRAKYAGEFSAVDLAYGFVVSSTVACGRIATIDIRAAKAVPGVLAVYTHKNRPEVAEDPKSYQDQVSPPGNPLRPLHDETIYFSGQPIALVVAEEFETARYAASLIETTYEEDLPATDLNEQRAQGYVPKRKREGYTPPASPRGNAEKAFDRAKHKVAAEYAVPFEHHNPMEPFATTAVYERDGTLTVYDKIQGVLNSQA